ncbi:hypothetical protein HC752_21080 [Vibrio sp. S9_S30]|uniref:hypothetical protein n=1 Tax=Vibrio sp. S9_S30 TaxID=2720226 RepID=UPI0016811AAB|nr:hypothetical protein [Vibrio sp. S9_S30]MBD1559440.1 hypothetical protein [Vibrio sp. S9_S30]
MTLVYLLDFDYDREASNKNKASYAKRFKNWCRRCFSWQNYPVLKKDVHVDFENGFETHLFNDREKLLKGLKKRKPDILLFDLFSNSESDACYEDLIVHKELDDTKCDVELALLDLQATRQYARRVLKRKCHPTGLEEIEYLICSSDIDVDFPIAIFSRFGRHLLSTEDMLKVQKYGGYFVWKDKKKSIDRYVNGFGKRERLSISSVISAYEENISRFDKSLLKERQKIVRLEKKIRFNKLSMVVEYTFVLAIICAALIHGKEWFDPGVVKSAAIISDILSFKYLSPFMLLTAIIYAVLIKIRGKNMGILLEAHRYSTNLVNDLVSSRIKNVSKE